MKITVVSLFPDFFGSALDASLLGKARAAGILDIDFVDPRDFTSDRHRTVDDAPYGGGHGMVIKPEPLHAAIEAASAKSDLAHRVFMTPAGAPLDQAAARRLASHSHLVLVCGRYEGIDERICQLAIDEQISVGDFVLSGGEPAALCLIDAVARLVPGVLGEIGSTEEESFSDGISLEYPQYTRPPEFRGLAVPEVLLGGNHAAIATWRRVEALRRTAARRPDLLARRRLSDEDLDRVGADPSVLPAARTSVVLCHHPVVDRLGDVVTTSVTNLDIHDIARSCTTFGLAGFMPVSPIAAQQDKIHHILSIWLGELDRLLAEDPAKAPSGHRGRALDLVRVEPSLESSIDRVAEQFGRRPLVVATSARRPGPGLPAPVGFRELLGLLAAEPARPMVLVLGTGHGLADSALHMADRVLTPIEGHTRFNHLSVRSAAAILLDRLFGAGLT